MKSTRSTNRALATSAMLLLIPVVAGCSGAEEIPPEEKEAINLGVNTSAGPVEVDNLLLVSRGISQPARLLGVLTNQSDENVDVTLADEDDHALVTLEPGQQFAFHETNTVFDTTDERPGALASVTITVADDSQTVEIPVRDGSLGWLEPYLPESAG